MTAMAVTAEEMELQDQVTRALENQGVLGKIKAQLRAAVFQAIHNSSTATSNGPLGTRASQSSVLPATAMLQSFGADAPVALELVRNFLECLELDHTLAVFLAEAGLTNADNTNASSEWRVPARLCDRVCVSSADEATPVLVKMLRGSVRESEPTKRVVESRTAEPASVSMRTHGGGGSFGKEERHEPPRVVELSPPKANTRLQDLPPPPLKATVAAPAANTLLQTHSRDDDDELDASMAEEVASGSFEEESLAESASVNHSQSEEFGKKPTTSQPMTARPGRFGIPNEEEQDKDDHEDEEERSPSVASPPPVPAKLGPLPSLPGMGSTGLHSKPTQAVPSDNEEEDEAAHSEAADDDDRDDEDDLDDDAAAARLLSLEAKLKEMEAEDDTGMLHQLKVTTLHETEDAPTLPPPGESPRKSMSGKGDVDGGDDDDNYGSDFEEETEEVDEEEEEVASEMSEDIASMSMLSESEDSAAQTKAKPEANKALENDTPVDSEDALNSYDYIEAVERH